MKIRSITCFYNPSDSANGGAIHSLAQFVKQAVAAFSDNGIEVQTTRLATTPFPRLLSELKLERAVELAKRLEAQAQEHGFSYIGLGPALPEAPESYAMIPAMLEATQNAFFGGVLGSAKMGISLAAVKACGEIIARSATITPDGFTNLRFTALANVPAYAPFFPAAYAADNKPAFALAVEAADLVVTAFSQAKSLDQARRSLLSVLEASGAKLSAISNDLEQKTGLQFRGIDFSPAPFPDDCCSLGAALEQLGLPQTGLLGSLSAAAFLAETLDRGRWPRAGFNGLMLPVLEDSRLALRTAGHLTVKDLLLFSAVCGTGLDTVPLPGSASQEQISALLLDLAVLAVRLDKPLTARLMPIPGKSAGERTAFQFDYFANGEIMELPAAPLTGALGGDETFELKPKHSFKKVN
jgi:uncharacterized protein (UPF0210 family)